MANPYLAYALLIFSAFGCIEVSEEKKVAGSGEPATASANATRVLVGTWKNCDTTFAIPELRLNSTGTTIVYGADSKLYLKSGHYSDDKCTKVYSQKDVDKVKAEIPENEKSAKQLLTPFEQTGTYKTSNLRSDGSGDMDVIEGGTTLYSSFMIVNNKMYLAQVCLSGKDQSDEACEISGDLPSRRAKVFNADYYVRVVDLDE